MDLLQIDSTVCVLLFHLRVCGPHVNFRGVDCKALAHTAASPYIKAAGWFFSLLVVVGRWLLVGQFHCHLAITSLACQAIPNR